MDKCIAEKFRIDGRESLQSSRDIIALSDPFRNVFTLSARQDFYDSYNNVSVNSPFRKESGPFYFLFF